MHIKNKLEYAIKKITGIVANVEIPEMESFGDYTTNAALVNTPSGFKNPREYAEHIIGKLKKDKVRENFSKIEIAGPGFINFTVKDACIKDMVVSISTHNDILEELKTIGKGKTVIVDYSSPNIAKRFSIGHLRSTVIGQALYNLFEVLGYKTIGDNHLGDWGTQFGKLIYMIKKEDLKEFTIEKLEELYVQFHTEAEDEKRGEEMESQARSWFKKLEEGDKEAKEIWQKCVDISIKEFEKIYKLLDIKIDHAYGESYYEAQMKKLKEDPNVDKYLTKGETGEGLVVDLSSVGINTPLMFEKSDGTTTYATRDLATIAFRVAKWDPDIIVYEIGAEQTLHFQQLFAASRLMGLVGSDVILHHTKHGLYLGEDGKKFRTRHGGTVKLEDVLNEAIERARKIVDSEKNSTLGGKEKDEIAKVVGINAIKYFDLSHSVTSDIIFSWEKLMAMNGNSAPYIMYTFTRAESVLEKAKGSAFDLKTSDWTSLSKEEEELIRCLIHFAEVVEMAGISFSPNVLALYLYKVSQKFNSFYNSNKIISDDEAETIKRVDITKAVVRVLGKGSEILGLQMVARM